MRTAGGHGCLLSLGVPGVVGAFVYLNIREPKRGNDGPEPRSTSLAHTRDISGLAAFRGSPDAGQPLVNRVVGLGLVGWTRRSAANYASAREAGSIPRPIHLLPALARPLLTGWLMGGASMHSPRRIHVPHGGVIAFATIHP